MNITTPQNKTPVPNQRPNTPSGFAPIPTRMQDLAPLVVDNASEIETQVVEQLQALESQLVTVHATAAEAYLSQGRYEEARDHIEVAIKWASDDPGYQNQCGFLRYMTGDDDGAIEMFERVIAQVPTQADSLSNLAMICFGREDYEQAKKWFALAVQQMPQDSELWNNLGASVFQVGTPQEAVHYFRKALELDPNNEDAKANLASC